MAIWSSSRGVYCIKTGLNAIYGERESRGYVYTRLVSVLYTVLLLAALSEGTTEVHAAAHLLPVEAQAVKDVVAKGAHVYFQQVPSQPVIEWDDVKDRF